MVVNMNMYSDEISDDSINVYLADTIAAVFENVSVVDVAGSTNKELFATDSEDYLTKLRDNIPLEENETLSSMMQRVSDTITDYESRGHLMTDDKAPVELLGMKQIDLIIKDEVSYYKEIYEKEGLKGLLELLN